MSSIKELFPQEIQYQIEIKAIFKYLFLYEFIYSKSGFEHASKHLIHFIFIFGYFIDIYFYLLSDLEMQMRRVIY